MGKPRSCYFCFVFSNIPYKFRGNTADGLNLSKSIKVVRANDISKIYIYKPNRETHWYGMKSAERDFFLSLTTKELYAFLVISLTVNFCVLFHFLTPFLCKILTRCLGRRRGESFVKFGLKKPGLFSQM